MVKWTVFLLPLWVGTSQASSAGSAVTWNSRNCNLEGKNGAVKGNVTDAICARYLDCQKLDEQEYGSNSDKEEACNKLDICVYEAKTNACKQNRDRKNNVCAPAKEDGHPWDINEVCHSITRGNCPERWQVKIGCCTGENAKYQGILAARTGFVCCNQPCAALHNSTVEKKDTCKWDQHQHCEQCRPGGRSIFGSSMPHNLDVPIPPDAVEAMFGMQPGKAMAYGVNSPGFGFMGLPGPMGAVAIEEMGVDKSKDRHLDEITADDIINVLIESISNDKDMFDYGAEIESDPWFGKEKSGGYSDHFKFVDPYLFIDQIYGSPFGLSQAQLNYGSLYGFSKKDFKQGHNYGPNRRGPQGRGGQGRQRNRGWGGQQGHGMGNQQGHGMGSFGMGNQQGHGMGGFGMGNQQGHGMGGFGMGNQQGHGMGNQQGHGMSGFGMGNQQGHGMGNQQGHGLGNRFNSQFGSGMGQHGRSSSPMQQQGQQFNNHGSQSGYQQYGSQGYQTNQAGYQTGYQTGQQSGGYQSGGQSGGYQSGGYQSGQPSGYQTGQPSGYQTGQPSGYQTGQHQADNSNSGYQTSKNAGYQNPKKSNKKQRKNKKPKSKSEYQSSKDNQQATYEPQSGYEQQSSYEQHSGHEQQSANEYLSKDSGSNYEHSQDNGLSYDYGQNNEAAYGAEERGSSYDEYSPPQSYVDLSPKETHYYEEPIGDMSSEIFTEYHKRK